MLTHTCAELDELQLKSRWGSILAAESLPGGFWLRRGTQSHFLLEQTVAWASPGHFKMGKKGKQEMFAQTKSLCLEEIVHAHM